MQLIVIQYYNISTCSPMLHVDVQQSVKSHLVEMLNKAIIIIISFITVFAGVLFVHQPGANHAPRASVTQVNHSVRTLSTFLRFVQIPACRSFESLS